MCTEVTEDMKSIVFIYQRFSQVYFYNLYEKNVFNRHKTVLVWTMCKETFFILSQEVSVPLKTIQ